MASPTLKIIQDGDDSETPTPTPSPSMDKPKTVATALEEIYYRLGGEEEAQSGTDVATLIWAISDLVGEGGGGSASAPIVAIQGEDALSFTMLSSNYSSIKSYVDSGVMPLFTKSGNGGIAFFPLLRLGEITGATTSYYVTLVDISNGVTYTFESTTADGDLVNADTPK